jgi:cation diffusion facilitator family transporter
VFLEGACPLRLSTLIIAGAGLSLSASVPCARNERPRVTSLRFAVSHMRARMKPKSRFLTGAACTKIGLGTNILLTVLKLWAGLAARSQALVADGINSLSDIVVSSVVYIAYKISREPADDNHPYGHGNAETIAGLTVSIGVIATGGVLAYGAVHSLSAGVRMPPTWLALYAAAASIVIKEALHRYTLFVADAEHSPGLKSSAKDYRSDVLASGAAFLGILGAHLGFPLLDPFAGLVIAALIIRMGIIVLAENVHILMAGAPTSGITEDVLQTVKSFKEVLSVPRIRLQRLGGRYVVNLDIAVDGRISVAEGHRIAESVRDRCLMVHERVSEVIVHVDPYRPKREE